MKKMKKSIIGISVIFMTLGMGILISCNSGTKSSDNQANSSDAATKKAVQSQPEANAEAVESHEVDRPGAGPHKGILEEAGEKNHIEMVMNGKDVAFYPCDEMTNPIDANGWTGKADFMYKDGKSKSIDLMLMDGALTAMGANSGKSFTVVATLTMSGQSISSKFSSEGSIEHNDNDSK